MAPVQKMTKNCATPTANKKMLFVELVGESTILMRPPRKCQKNPMLAGIFIFISEPLLPYAEQNQQRTASAPAASDRTTKASVRVVIFCFHN